MKQKTIFFILIALIVISLTGIASANTDLGITEIQTDSSMYRGNTYFANITIENYGLDDYNGGDNLTFDNGDGTIVNHTLPPIANGSSTNVLIPIGYNTLGNFDLEANISSVTIGGTDINMLNNDKTETITISNHLPVITSAGTINLVVNNELIYDIGAITNDDDGSLDTLTYSLISSPSGMNIDSATGEISGWIPTSVGTETFTVQVSDGHDVVSELFYVNVQADQARIEFQDNEVVFGDDNTARGDSVTKTILVENTGTQVLTNIQAELLDTHGNQIVGIPLQSMTISPSSATLNPGDSVTITIQFEIPANVDSKQTAFGTLKVTAQDPSSNEVSDVINTYTEAESFLDIEDCDIIVDGDSSSCSGTVDVKEGSSIELKVNVENLYSSDDINNVKVEIYDDNGWNIDEDSDSYDIDGGDDKEFTITFTLDNELDEDDTQLTIEVYGKDDNENFKHFASETLDLEVDREDDEVRIDSFDLLNNIIYNDEQFVDLEVTIRNSGYDDQDHAKIRVVCPELNIDKVKDDISINSLQTKTERLQLEVPLHIEADEYTLSIYSYYDDTHMSGHVQTTTLTVLDSGSSSSSNEESSSSENNNEGNNIGVNVGNNNNIPPLVDPIPEPTYGTSTKTSDSPWFIAFLIVVVILVLGGIAFLISEFMAMQKAKNKKPVSKKPAKKQAVKKTSKAGTYKKPTKSTTKTSSKKAVKKTSGKKVSNTSKNKKK